jgi:hypothetical protein
VSYVVVSYAIVLVALVLYGASQRRARSRLRTALDGARDRDRP